MIVSYFDNNGDSGMKFRAEVLENVVAEPTFSSLVIHEHRTTSISAQAYYFKLTSFSWFVLTERAYYPRGCTIQRFTS